MTPLRYSISAGEAPLQYMTVDMTGECISPTQFHTSTQLVCIAEVKPLQYSSVGEAPMNFIQVARLVSALFHIKELCNMMIVMIKNIMVFSRK